MRERTLLPHSCATGRGVVFSLQFLRTRFTVPVLPDTDGSTAGIYLKLHLPARRGNTPCGDVNQEKKPAGGYREAFFAPLETLIIHTSPLLSILYLLG